MFSGISSGGESPPEKCEREFVMYPSHTEAPCRFIRINIDGMAHFIEIDNIESATESDGRFEISVRDRYDGYKIWMTEPDDIKTAKRILDLMTLQEVRQLVPTRPQ